jgi:hypothetical protein
MLYTKIKVGLVVVLGATLLGGSGVFTYGTKAGQPPGTPKVEKPGARSDVKVVQRPQEEQERLQQMQQQIEQQQREIADSDRLIRELRMRLERAEAMAKERGEFVEKALRTVEPRQPQADEKSAHVGAARISSPAEREHAERVLQAREEVELLEAQLLVKEAQFSAERRKADIIRQRVQQTSAPLDRLKAEEELATLEAQLMVRQAELREPQVRLAQAKRRLAVLTGSAEPPPNPKQPQPGQRQRELDKRLDALGKELEALRRELKGQEPRSR